VERLERIRDQRQFVGPVPVDCGLAHARASGDGLDRQPPVTHHRELIDGGLEDHHAGALDPGVNPLIVWSAHRRE
jgi:hypothetical protein